MNELEIRICFGAIAASVIACSSGNDTTPADSGANDAAKEAAADVVSQDAEAGAPLQYMAMIRGKLAGVTYADGGDAGAADLSQAKAAHDQIAKGGEASAKQAGDIAHAVLLGTNILDGVPNEFLAMDRWTDSTAMKAFYANPQIQQAFGTLFSSPPTIDYFVSADGWVSWGDMHSGDAYTPHYVHLALGTLSSKDTATNEAAHNQVASGGKDPSIGAGNVAHVVWLGLEDAQQFNGVDIWKADDNIQAFYTNPQFVAAFSQLFTSVSQPVYVSTDWYQW
jgi:quinol monooxygenase YgiN